MGVAAGDCNGDGFRGLFVTGYNRSILYRNNGNGTFTDVTERSGIVVPGWASSALSGSITTTTGDSTSLSAIPLNSPRRTISSVAMEAQANATIAIIRHAAT
jgi:FG-GAP-like repeat